MFYSIIHHFQSRKQLYKYKTFWMFSFLPSGVTSRKWDGRGEREVKWETEMVSGLVKCKILDFIWCFPRSLRSWPVRPRWRVREASLGNYWTLIETWRKYRLQLSADRGKKLRGLRTTKLQVAFPGPERNIHVSSVNIGPGHLMMLSSKGRYFQGTKYKNKI